MMAAIAKPKLIIGSRTSKLAMWQTEHVIALLRQAWPDLQCRVETYITEGDEITDTPLPEFGGKGVFTTLLERALVNREIDLAVHSLKDLPTAGAKGLVVGAVTTRADTRDVLVARNGCTLATLPAGAVVGTSSVRRQAQLSAVRRDLEIRSIRGNVDSRVRKVQAGEYDATVLAAAGVERLGLTDHVSEWLPLETMLPAPGQGALAVQCRADDTKTMDLLAAIDDTKVRAAVTAERRFLECLGGGCSLPIAAHATVIGDNGSVTMSGLVISADGRDVVRVEGTAGDARSLGERLAREAIELGAQAILSGLTDVDNQESDVSNAAMHEPSRATDKRTTHDKPLHGKRVVVTRARHQVEPLINSLSELGATPLAMPVIRISPMTDLQPLDDALRSLTAYDWALFTSANAVKIVWDRMATTHIDPSVFDRVRVGAVGSSTATALSARGVTPSFVPDKFVGEAIASGIGKVQGQRILLARARIANDTLPRMLEEMGAVVDDIPVYDTLPIDLDDSQLAEIERGVDIVTFTSASTVRNFLTAMRTHERAFKFAQHTVVACIGPVTAQAAREFGLRVDVVPSEYTIAGLVDSLVQHFQERQT